MKTKIIVFGILFLNSLLSFAQKDDIVKYKELENDPNDIPNLEFYLAPAYLDVSMKNILQAGFGLGMQGTISDKMNFHVSYFQPYTSELYSYNNSSADDAVNHNLKNPQDESIVLNQNFNSISSFELGAGLILSDKTASKNVMINLAQQQTGNIIVNTVTSVETNVRKRVAVRGGYYRYSSTNELFAGLDADYILTTNGDQLYSDGIVYSDVNYDDLYGDIIGRDYTTFDQIGDWLIDASTNSLYVGFELEYITNLIVETETYGKRSNQKAIKFYGDIFFGGKTEVKDFLFFESDPSATNIEEETGTNIVNYKLSVGENENQLPISNLGFRIGFESRGIAPSRFVKWEAKDETTRLLNFGNKFEAGYLPGIGGNYYFRYALMLIINK